MFERPVQMQHVSLSMMKEDAPAAAIALAEMQIIHMIEKHSAQELLTEQPAEEYQKLFQQLSNRYKKIEQYSADLQQPPLTRPESVTLAALSQANQDAQLLWQEISVREENIRIAREKIRTASQLANSLSRFENLNLDLGRLSQNSLFIKIFIGTVPHSEITQLKRAASLANSVIEVFHNAEILDYVTVVSELSEQQDILEILNAAGFRQIEIPPELRSRPDKIKDNIQQQFEENEAIIAEETKRISDILQKNRNVLAEICITLSYARPYASLGESLSGKGQLVYLEGWIPAGKEAAINKQLRQKLVYPFLLTLRAPTHDELALVPTLQKTGRLLQPFAALVNQFGIPEYVEIDPTRLFALSYTLMFGMMFGDIGHGAVIVIMGFLLRKRLSGLAIFTTLAGMSSIVFGFLYGSIFGYENMIHPLWMSPMHDPESILLVALSWGIGFIVTVNLLSIRNLFALGHRRQAWLGSKGIAGLVFFAGCIFAGYQFMVNQQFAMNETLAVLLPLTLIMINEWYQLEGGKTEKLLVVMIEGLDNLINTLSGTLSFLRIAAFSLNHVALAAAVFTLAGMMDSFGHWLTILLGNLFIIVLEGGIVAIQCLRLEYYEGFSRFFSGKGQRFKPLKIEAG
jgi:V/A-type H+-transporting ATPase subunit I